METERQPEITLDLTDDMYMGALPAECIEDFVCMLCYGVVFNPIKCKQCETLFCKNCFLANRFNTENRHHRGNLKELHFSCFKKCGSTEFSWKLDAQEQEILNGLEFQCQNDDCEEAVLYGNYRNHCKNECKSCTYEKVHLPGDLEAKEASKNAKKGYHYQREQERLEAARKLEYGILNKLFLEEGEELEKEEVK